MGITDTNANRLFDEADGTEIDDDECLEFYDNSRILVIGAEWKPAVLSVETATSTQHLLPRFLARQRHHPRQWTRSTFPHLLHQAHKFRHLQGHQRPGLWTQVWNLQTKAGLIPPRIIRRQKNYKRGKHTEAFIDGKHST